MAQEATGFGMPATSTRHAAIAGDRQALVQKRGISILRATPGSSVRNVSLAVDDEPTHAVSALRSECRAYRRKISDILLDIIRNH
jgi:hypothetical protein